MVKLLLFALENRVLGLELLNLEKELSLELSIDFFEHGDLNFTLSNLFLLHRVLHVDALGRLSRLDHKVIVLLLQLVDFFNLRLVSGLLVSDLYIEGLDLACMFSFKLGIFKL